MFAHNLATDTEKLHLTLFLCETTQFLVLPTSRPRSHLLLAAITSMGVYTLLGISGSSTSFRGDNYTHEVSSRALFLCRERRCLIFTSKKVWVQLSLTRSKIMENWRNVSLDFYFRLRFHFWLPCLSWEKLRNLWQSESPYQTKHEISKKVLSGVKKHPLNPFHFKDNFNTIFVVKSHDSNGISSLSILTWWGRASLSVITFVVEPFILTKNFSIY